MRNIFTVKLAVSSLLIGAGPAAAADAEWPQFRGPGSNGISTAAGLPTRWSATENVVWKTAIPGVGWSSPVAAGDLVFLTSAISADNKEAPKKGLYFGGNRDKPKDEHRSMVYAVGISSGKIAWEREVHKSAPPIARHLKNSYASETPATDGDRVYAQFGSHGLYCLDARTGKLLWTKTWEPRETRYGWGTAASPVLHEGRVYVVSDNDVESFLTALDKKTGREIWRVKRDEKSNWATPFIWQHDSSAEIVTPGTTRVRSYDLDGKVLWEMGGMSSITIPTPFTRHGLLYVTSGYVGDQTRPVFVIKPGARGDISLKAGETSSQYVAWSYPQAGPYNPSPLVYGDIYYTLFDRGFFTAHDARTGVAVYPRVRIDEAAGAFTASPWAYDGKVFALSEDGDTFVIEAGKEYKLLGKNSIDEMCMATPAIAKGSLFIRGAIHLYRIANTAR